MHLPNSLSALKAAAIVCLVTSALPIRRNHLLAMDAISRSGSGTQIVALELRTQKVLFALSVLETSRLAFVRVYKDSAEA